MTRVERWEHRSEWPLAGAALLFLGAYAWPILDTSLPHGWRQVCDLVNWALWAVFAADYIVRLVLAERRGNYLLHHIPDLLIVALPILRPLRLLRLLMLLRMLNLWASDSLRGRVGVYVGGATVVILMCALVAVLGTPNDGTAPSSVDSGGVVIRPRLRADGGAVRTLLG